MGHEHFPDPSPPKDKKDLTAYDNLPPGLKRQWDEKYFNMVKLRNTLLDGDAVLSWAFVLWVLVFAGMVTILYGVNPERFPIRMEMCFSLSAFLLYYSVIGFVRRQAERNLNAMCAQQSNDECSSGKIVRHKRPFREEDDPPLAHFAFGLREKLRIPFTNIHFPRRGLGQGTVVLYQFIVGAVYLGNYSYYVLWDGNVSAKMFPTLLWTLHVTITLGALFILLKNAGFLVDTRKMLNMIEGLVGSFLGHVGKNHSGLGEEGDTSSHPR